MGVVTNGVGTASTSNVATYASGSFTPAANDLLIAFVTVSGNTDANGYITDSQNLGWDLITTALFASSANKIYAFVAKKLAAATSMTVTYNISSGTATGCVIQVARVSGITMTGIAAIRQSTTVANQASGSAPAPAFSSNCLTGNPTLTVVGDSTNPPGLTAPTSWTSQSNTGYATPTTGAQYASRNSGFTSTTITWGSSAGSAFGAIAIEVNVDAPPSTPTLSTPSNGATGTSTTPDLDFTDTDPNSDTIRYEVQVDTINTFNSQAAVVGCVKMTASSGYLSNTTAISTVLNTLSFFTWIKLGSTGNNFMIFRNGIDTSFGQGYGFYISGTDGTLNIDVSFVANLQATNLAITDTNEHFVGFTCDAQGNWVIYLDGSSQAVGHSVPFSLDSSSATCFNVEYNGSGTFAVNNEDGTYEGAGFWERMLNTSEINNMFNHRIAPNKLASTANLVMYLAFTNSGNWGLNSGTGANLTVTGTIAAATSGYPSPLLDKLSGTDAGYGDITNSGNTDPFPSGDSMKYTIQAGNALINGVQYFWRVRAVDPTAPGTAIWSSWSSTFSFTPGSSFTWQMLGDADAENFPTPPKNTVYLYPTFFPDTKVLTLKERVSVDKFSPIRQDWIPKKPEMQYLYPSLFQDTKVLTLKERVQLDKFAPIQQDWIPRKAELQFLYPSFFIDTKIMTQKERAQLDKFAPIQPDILFDIKRAQYLYTSYFYDPKQLTQQERAQVDKFGPILPQINYKKAELQFLYPNVFFVYKPVAPIFSTDKFGPTLDEKFRDIPRTQYNYPSYFPDVKVLTLKERVSLDKFEPILDEKFRDVARLQYLYPSVFQDTKGLTQHEKVLLDKFAPILDDKFRDIQRLQYSYPYLFIDTQILTKHEAVLLDKFSPILDDKFRDVQRLQYTYPSFFTDAKELTLHETVYLSEFEFKLEDFIPDIKRLQYLYPSLSQTLLVFAPPLPPVIGGPKNTFLRLARDRDYMNKHDHRNWQRMRTTQQYNRLNAVERTVLKIKSNKL